MIDLVRTLGTTKQGPEIYLAVPPPLMARRVYGMNYTVINSVFPTLIPAIAKANGINASHVIDVFDALGGSDLKQFPRGGCTLENAKSAAKCEYFCSSTQSWSCDQCHPDDIGYHEVAVTMKAGLGL